MGWGRGGLRAKSAQERLDASKARARSLASAFFGDETRADKSSFAASAAHAFSAATLGTARAQPAFVQQVERCRRPRPPPPTSTP